MYTDELDGPHSPCVIGININLTGAVTCALNGAIVYA